MPSVGPPHDIPGSVDVLVIGAGMAGLAAAAELGRRGEHSVAVLDAGPDRGRQHIRAEYSPQDATRLCFYPDTDPDFWRPYRGADAAYQCLAGLRRRVGGRSLYWGGVLLPIEPWAIADGWPASVAAELTSAWDGGSGLYQRVIDDVVRWGSEPLTGQGIEVGGFAFARTPRAVRPGPAGRWSAFSPLHWWDKDHGDPAVRRVPIIAAHSALGVLVDRGRAVGVKARAVGGEPRDIRARRVVLAAGTVENSRLTVQALASADGRAGCELPGLVDKIAQGFTCTFPDAGRLPPAVRAAAREGRAYHRAGAAGTRSNHFVRFAETAARSITMDSWMMGEQRRGEHSRVICQHLGEWPWPTTVSARPSPADEELRITQQQLLNHFWEAAAEAFSVPFKPLEFTTGHGSADLVARLTAERQTPLTYTFPLGSELHEAGTTAFAELIGEDHQFRDVPGLYACGPSTFPRTGAANPSMTTLALGKRLGAILS